MRTLRQRPKVVDHTRHGEPIFEVRSVRLMLRPDADHFNRLAECSKCGRNVPGPPVLTLGDLDRPANSVICKECVRDATASPSRPAPRPAATPQPGPPSTKAGRHLDGRAAPEPVDGGRLARVESQLQTAMTRLDELAAVQRVESVERRGGEQAAESTIRAALVAELAALRAEVKAAVEATEHRVAAHDETLRRSIAGVAEALAGQRDRLAAVSGAVEQTREEFRAALAESQPGASAMGAGWAEELERRIHAAVNAALANTDVTSLREQLQGNALALTRMVEVQRADLETALEDRLGIELSTIHQSLAELVKGQAELEERVAGMAQDGWRLQAQVRALDAAVDGSASRLQLMEQKLDESVRQMTELLNAQRRELGTASAKPRSVGEATFTPGAGGGDFLDDLERQLRAAETRLAEITSPRQES